MNAILSGLGNWANYRLIKQLRKFND